MAKFIIALAAILGLFILLRVGVTFASRSPAIAGSNSTSGSEQLGDCTKKPNCQGSQSSRKSQTVDALTITLNASNAMPALVTAINELGGKIAQKQDNYVHATFKSPLMGYTDDVEMLVDVASNEVQIRSASRLGYSDLGANKKRIAKIRRQLAGKL